MSNKFLWIAAIGLPSFFLLASCATIPKGAKPVTGFQADRYLGKWYEIARFDFRFERNLNNVTAQYSYNPNGTIKVLNSGYNYKKQEWKSATGKAKFRGNKDVAALKVSFFGPFYAAYNVIDIDNDYKYALVAGKNLNYLWILSRTTTIPANIRERLLGKAISLGYDTASLIWVEHQASGFK